MKAELARKHQRPTEWEDALWALVTSECRNGANHVSLVQALAIANRNDDAFAAASQELEAHAANHQLRAVDAQALLARSSSVEDMARSAQMFDIAMAVKTNLRQQFATPALQAFRQDASRLRRAGKIATARATDAVARKVQNAGLAEIEQGI